MQQVISVEQAKAITGGREPLLPAEYELALQALEECTTVDEAKYWSTKADVLAAWSKIYHSDAVMRRAKLLKLHAYRRMAEVAAQLKSKPNRKAPDSPTKVLRAQGLTPKQVQGVMAVGAMPKAEFDKVLAAERIPSPTALIPGQMRRRPANAGAASLESLRAFHYFCTRVSATSVAQGMSPSDKAYVQRVAGEVIDWLEELVEET